MTLFLNVLGLAGALVLLLTALRVLTVARFGEVSPRSGMAFAAAMAGAVPFGYVLSGSDLSFGYVLTLDVAGIYILYRLHQAKQATLDPKRETDFAELL